MGGIRIMGLALEKADPSRSADEWISYASLAATMAEDKTGNGGHNSTGNGPLN